MKSITHKLCLAAALFATSSMANAALVATFTESGSDVTLSIEGSLDTNTLTGTTGAGNNNNALRLRINPSLPQLLFNTTTTETSLSQYTITGTSPTFGTGASQDYIQSAISGSAIIYMYNNNFLLPTSYASGTTLTGNATISDSTLSGLGLTAGTYVYNLSGTGDQQTFTIKVIDPNAPLSAVPLPAGAPLLLSALAGFGWLYRRRKQRA